MYQIYKPKDADLARSKAVRRLMQDWKELEREPVGTVAAAPDDKDVFIWHCNLRPRSGIYRGIVFHLELIFPPTYPHQPPTLRMCTVIPHPNVFDEGFICLNMLREPQTGPDGKLVPWSGWSTAYTVQSVLLQLQSFLFAENIPQDSGYSYKQESSLRGVSEAKAEIMRFKCKCGHTYEHPHPALPEEDSTKGVAEDAEFEHPIDLSKNVLNPLDMDDGLYIDRSQLIVSKRNRVGWQGVRADKGAYLGPLSEGGLFYEAVIGRGLGVCRVGFALEGAARDLGTDELGWGFGGTGKKAHGDKFIDYGEGYQQDDVVGAYCHLSSGRIFFLKNGENLGCAFVIPEKYLDGQHKIYPALCLRESNVRLNFGRSGWLKPPRFARLAIARPAMSLAIERPKKAAPAPKNDGTDHLTVLPTELIIEIVQGMPRRDLLNLLKTCRRIFAVISTFSILERRDLVCYHSKVNWTEDVLGVGIGTAFVGSKIEFRSPLELLSSRAFTEEQVRRSVFQQKFEHFLPLIINPHHARRAQPQIERGINNLFKEITDSAGTAVEGAVVTFTSKVIAVLARLMNSQIVGLLYDHAGAARTFEKRFHVDGYLSERALLGFASFHHMFLYFRERLVDLRERVNAIVERFIKEPSSRHKTGTPDLGEFLVILSLSDFTWADVAEPFLKELFDRHVRWTLEVHPQLAKISSDLPQGVDEERLRLTFQANKTSLRVVMFQVFFHSHYCKPDGRTVDAVLERYNKSFGVPNGAMKRSLEEAATAILKVEGWPAFFDRVAMACPSKRLLTQMLHRAIKNSEEKTYHTRPHNPRR